MIERGIQWPRAFARATQDPGPVEEKAIARAVPLLAIQEAVRLRHRWKAHPSSMAITTRARFRSRLTTSPKRFSQPYLAFSR